MNIIAEKPETKILSSSLNFKPLGFIFIAIIILSALSFFLLFFLKRPKGEKDVSSIELGIQGIGIRVNSKIINNQMNKILNATIEKEGKYLRFLDENEFNKKDGILYNITKGIIKIKLYFNSPLTNLDHLFEDCKDIIYINLSHIQPSSINSMSQTFKGCEQLQKIDLTSVDTSKVTSMGSLFEGCTNLLEIKGIEDFDTSSLNNISRMFYNCENLTLANLSAFNIGNIFNINKIFDNNLNLKYIDLRKSSNASSIINILPQTKSNLTVFINEDIHKVLNHSYNNTNIKFLSNIENLKCNIGTDYKCNSCKKNSFSLECGDCNEGYTISLDYLSKMRCWKLEQIEEKGEEIENKTINYDEEEEEEKSSILEKEEEEKEKEKEKVDEDKEEENDIKVNKEEEEEKPVEEKEEEKEQDDKEENGEGKKNDNI